MLVVGPLFQIVAFLVQFLALPFPAFALSFALGGIGMVFQVSYKELQAIIALLTRSRMPLRMASLRVFKKTRNIKWVVYMLHMVYLFPNTPLQRTDVFHRRRSISRTPIRHLLRSINIVLVTSLSYLAFTSRLEFGRSCRSFQVPTPGRYAYWPIQEYDTDMGR